jgi:germination protein M
MPARKRNDKRPASNAGTVFWLTAIVIVLFAFALNWGKIQKTLESTNFREIVKTQTGSDKAPAKPDAAKRPSEAAPEAKVAADPTAPAAPAAAAPADGAKSAAPAPKATQASPQEEPASEPAAAPAAEPAAAGPKAAAKTQVPAAPAPRTRAAALFFVRIDDDGIIVRQEVKRQVAVSDSPLLDSLGALLKGPSEDEIRKKLISLVPQGTKLLSAQVRGSTAFLNFNEAFMYNHYGIEGYAGQLKQVVYTATSFPTVQDVQILIEGERHDYLGGEGVFIGRPLSRNSF